MKVAYFDFCLNTTIYEDYSLYPNRYGAGRIFVSYLKQMKDFHIFANSRCFNNLGKYDNKDNCHVVTDEQIYRILNGGENVCQVVPELNDFDIFFHRETAYYFNTGDLKQIVWSAGYQEIINERHIHLLLYNDYQYPLIMNPNTNIIKFQLGKELPSFFMEREKEDYIFQCTRHDPAFNTIAVADFCNIYGVKGIFAGPCYTYDLMSHIDNVHTFYLGEISEAKKLELTSKARLYTFLHNWNTPFNISALESLSLGTPIVSTHMGFWPSLVQPGVNGFFATNENDLMYAWENAPKLRQSDCYLSALPYNHLSMINSVTEALKKCL